MGERRRSCNLERDTPADVADRRAVALADRLVATGFAGMRVPSFAAGAGPDDVNLVLWRWSGRRPSRVVLIDDEGRLTKIKSEFRDVHEPAGRRIAATDPRTGP